MLITSVFLPVLEQCIYLSLLCTEALNGGPHLMLHVPLLLSDAFETLLSVYLVDCTP